ncbi:MAG TPA: hypothetical protein VMT20_16170 [Terriglobia bacterium]|nr:hypothetical protein [Terriglobia bacterium]
MQKTSIWSRTGRALLALAAMALFTAPPAMAQMGGGPGRSMRGPLYDPSTETTVKGTVEEVQQLTGNQMQGASGTMWSTCPRGWAGTHLALRTDQGTLIVHVGPAAYLANKNFSISKGDELSITGSKVQSQGSDFLIAREITKGNQLLTLRDTKGFPLWSGQRSGRPMQAPPAAN